MLMRAVERSESTPSRAPLLAAALHSVLVSLPLLFPRGFYYDWYVHLWMASYVAHHLFTDGVVPVFVNIEEEIGNPAILFYGSSFYTAVAPFVAALGPDVGIRVAAALAIFGSALALADIVRRCEPCALTGSSLVVILASSIYLMTTIYSRGHFAEFFAWQLLLLGGAMSLRAGLLGDRADAALSLLLGMVAFAIAAATHPPTTYLAALFLPIPALFWALWRRDSVRDRMAALWPAMLAGIAAFAPVATWALLVFRHRGDLSRYAGPLVYMPSSLDHWLARLAPWPVDLRVEIEGFAHVATPYLAAPVNVLALGLVGWLAWSAHATAQRPHERSLSRTAFLVAATGTIAVALAISLPVWPLRRIGVLPADSALIATAAYPGTWIGRLFGRVDAAYRFAGITNLVAVFSACALLIAARGKRPRAGGRPGQWPVFLVAAATVALTGTVQKVADVAKEYVIFPGIARDSARIRGPVPAADALLRVHDSVEQRLRTQIRVPDRMPEGVSIAHINFYAMPGLLPPLGDADGRIAVAVRWRSAGWARYAAAVSCERACVALTTLAVSPFFDLTVDGAAAERSVLRQRDGLVAIALGPGDHRLEVRLGTGLTGVVSVGALADVAAFWAVAAVIGLRAVRRQWPIGKRVAVEVGQAPDRGRGG
jgi:hypothetical protein